MGVGGEAEKQPQGEAELRSGQKRHHDGKPSGGARHTAVLIALISLFSGMLWLRW